MFATLWSTFPRFWSARADTWTSECDRTLRPWPGAGPQVHQPPARHQPWIQLWICWRPTREHDHCPHAVSSCLTVTLPLIRSVCRWRWRGWSAGSTLSPVFWTPAPCVSRSSLVFCDADCCDAVIVMMWWCSVQAPDVTSPRVTTHLDLCTDTSSHLLWI